MKFNVLLAGVGGEGILLVAKIIEKSANLENDDVTGVQIHGLAQRGGSVPTHIRFGHGLHSPLIAKGDADLIFALEPVEAARACYFASKEKTNFLIDDFPMIPFNVKASGAQYPTMEQIHAMIKPFANIVFSVKASETCAQKLGNPVFGNIMCLGVAIEQRLLPLSEKSVLDAMKFLVPHNIDENIQAFYEGTHWRPHRAWSIDGA